MACITLFAFASLQYELDARRTTAELINAASNLALPDKKTVSVRNTTQLYLTRLNDCDECDVVLNVHSGFLVEGSRFQVASLVTWMANSYRLLVYSVEYRLSSQGATYAETLDDVVKSERWIRRRHPGKRLILVGASTGAGIALSMSRRGMSLADLVVLDSPPTCFQTFDEQALHNAYTSALLDVVGKKPSDAPLYAFPSQRGEQMTPDCASPLTVPTLTIHSEYDPIVPYEQTLSLRGLPNSTVCIAEGGIHIVSLSSACRSAVSERLEALGVEREAFVVRTSADASAAVTFFQSTLAAQWVPASVIVFYLCLVRMDPLLAAYMDC